MGGQLAIKGSAGRASRRRSHCAQVQAFYEKHPYPPGRRSGGLPPTWTRERRRADAHLFWPDEAYRDDRSILVAGCGTSQAAKHALRWPRRGDRHRRQRRKHRGDRKAEAQVRPRQSRGAPVAARAVAELGRSFDHIVCTGVLHHLPDPGAGLRALRDVLEPDGAMHLMVYAPYGRAGVYMLQDYCRRLGIGTTTAEIRDLAAALRRFHRIIRCNRCCARRRISRTRPGWPMRCCTRRTGPIRFRSCSN